MLANPTGEIVIKPKWSRGRRLLVGAGSVIVGAIIVFGAYYFGFNAGGVRLAATEQRLQALTQKMEQVARHNAQRAKMLTSQRATEISRLTDWNEDLQRQNRELAAALSGAHQQLEIDGIAYAELSESLQNSATEISKLREDLDFYRNIISPADGRAGLRVQNVVVTPGLSANEFGYVITLIQALKHDAEISGEVQVEIEGWQAGESVTLPGQAFGLAPTLVKFRYFQNLEGLWRMPRDFQPRRVKVKVILPGSAPATERWYPWPPI